MKIEQLLINKKDIDIINNIKNNYSKEKNNKIDYKNKICKKPWGYEFLSYESNKIGIWTINITKNNKTSLHTHFNKDTILIVIKGCVKINLIDEYKILTIMDIINIPKNKFHSIECITDESTILEIEIFNSILDFSDKNDLYRINDDYNRENIGYEKSVEISTELDKYNYFYFNDNYKDNIFEIINIEPNNIFIYDNNSINILLEGIINNNCLYYKEGSIINFNINNNNEKIKLLKINFSPYLNEEKKIIYNLEHLELIMNNLRHKKNILTSGCFDIIHIGHLEILKNSKILGDNLFVCLSNDKQVKILKGSNRPINNYNDRIRLFKTISYVDYIILYDEEDIKNEKTLDKIMNIVNPLYWTKGTDYIKEDIIKKHPRINIKLIENIHNISTTKLILNINNSI